MIEQRLKTAMWVESKISAQKIPKISLGNRFVGNYFYIYVSICLFTNYYFL